MNTVARLSCGVALVGIVVGMGWVGARGARGESPVAGAGTTRAAEEGWVTLFGEEGVPKGWLVRDWSDVGKAPPEGAVWVVKGGVLHGSEPRGTWLVSEKVYGDFQLELEFRIGEAGNSGVGLRFPDAGDPAFDGMELQICDERYYTRYGQQYDAASLTGSLYAAVPPKEQAYRAGEWNRYEVTCRGARVRAMLNGVVVQDVNLDEQTKALPRGKALKDRPRRGHLGFQELSRGGGHVEIRKARVKELDGGK